MIHNSPFVYAIYCYSAESRHIHQQHFFICTYTCP